MSQISKRLAAVLAMSLSLAACATPREAAQPSPDTIGPKQPWTASFFVIGDTGVIGDKGSLPHTSHMVREHCRPAARCDFGLMSGDNIYPDGATGDPAIDAPTFDALFTRPFGAIWADVDRPAQPRFYVSLGNHDWYNGRAGAEAQVRFHEASRPFYMDGFFYSRRFDLRGKSIEVFVIDTEMLLSSHTLPDYDGTADGAMVASGKTDPGGTPNALPQTEAERAQVAWLEEALVRSTADWKLVLGHHPIWQGRGDSKYAQSIKLRELILPALCRNADAYFAGHQHTIEVYQDSCETVTGSAGGPLPQIVSGAGAKAREIDPAFIAWQASQFPQMRKLFAQGDIAGFVAVQLDDEGMSVVPATGAEGEPAFHHPALKFRKRTRR